MSVYTLVCPSVRPSQNNVGFNSSTNHNVSIPGGRACSTRTADFLLSPSTKLGMLRLCNRSCLLSTNAVLWVLSDIKSGVILCICPVTDISATR